jgi:diacylglycerol kinase family enzyme
MYNKKIATYSQPVLIYNPRAGRLNRDRGQLLQRSIAALAESGIRPEQMPTTGPGAATTLVREAIDRGADLILVAGGDGTVNEVVNGMAGSEVPLGVLPGGTANVLCMEMRTGSRMDRVARSMCQYVPERIALGRVKPAGMEPRHFLLMAGAGVDAEIVHAVDPAHKARFGRFAYWAGGFAQALRRFGHFDVEVNGRTHQASFALTTRVRNYGGDLEIAREVSLLEPDFEVVLFRGGSGFRYLPYLGAILLRQLTAVPGVTVLRTNKLRIKPADSIVRLQVDGELSGQAPVEIEIVPSALTLMMPADLRERLGLSLRREAPAAQPVPMTMRRAHPNARS